jgi:hypothetical protein
VSYSGCAGELGAPRAKKRLQTLAARLLQDATGNLDAVIQTLGIEGMRSAVDRAAFRIVSAEYQAPDAGVNHGAGAHQAGFQRDVQRAAREPVIAEPLRGLTHGNDFGMGSRIVTGDRAIPALADKLAVLHHDSSDRHFPFLGTALGQRQRIVHPADIVGLLSYAARHFTSENAEDTEVFKQDRNLA